MSPWKSIRNLGLSLVAIFPSMSLDGRVALPATSTESTARAPDGIEAHPAVSDAARLVVARMRARGEAEGLPMCGAFTGARMGASGHEARGGTKGPCAWDVPRGTFGA